jgi:phosphoribosylanthranilate isomerase
MSLCNLDLAQLHGSESPHFCQALFPRVIKALRVKDESILSLLPQYKVSAYLLDSYDVALKGGTGQSFNWEIAKQAKRYGPVILSGGLTPANVCKAIASVQPYAVDVSSGVESQPGKKDHHKLRAFLETVKNAQTISGGSHKF